MSGPNVQMPSALSPMFDIVTDDEGRLIALNLRPDWAAMFSAMQQLMVATTRYGTTANRPTSAMVARYVGMPYFDTDLGLPVFLKTASSSAWVKADGIAA